VHQYEIDSEKCHIKILDLYLQEFPSEAKEKDKATSCNFIRSISSCSDLKLYQMERACVISWYF